MSDEKSFDYWQFFVEEARRVNCPLYARLAEGIGADPEMRALAGQAKKGQPPANILLAAVHFHLLRGADHPLRRFYPNLNGGTSVDGDPFPDFVDFVRKHRQTLLPLVLTKVTNTNEVGRSAHLHAGFRTLAKDAGEPLNLIEIGPSAGLNLIWDRYAVRYRRGGEVFELPVKDPALVIDCELRGDLLPPLGPTPKVASRVGLELNPVDLSDPDQRDWLRALVWPDMVTRFARLEAALKAYETNKPEIRAGSALDLLTDALRAIPENQTVCVYHSYAVYQFSREMKDALESILTLAGLRRPVWRLGVEGDVHGVNAMELMRYQDGVRDVSRLALCHPHGAWIEWRGDPFAASDWMSTVV